MLYINIVGVLLIAFIVWWFWLYKPPSSQAGETSLIISVANGVYTPSQIRLVAGKKTQLTFLREDQSPCAEIVVFPNLQLSQSLPLGKNQIVELPTLQPGSYDFHCQMQMYRGQLIVE